MKRFAKVVGGSGALLIVLAAVLVANAFRLDSRQRSVQPTTIAPVDGATERLAQAVRIPTVSHAGEPERTAEEFRALHALLQANYPKVHQRLKREVVEPCSLLYEWPGKDPKAAPALLTAHMDVVPVEEAQVGKWTHEPFGGVVADGYLWGRGTMDDKVGVVGILEGAEAALAAGHQPQRTVYFAFGCDEEVGGKFGAQKIAKLLKSRNVKAEFALDEGYAVTKGLLPGIDEPIALIGLAEKGFVTFTLKVEAEGGHSSMPPPSTAIGVLSAAIHRLEENQMEAELNPATGQMFEYLGPHMSFDKRMVFGNMWLFESIVLGQLAGAPTTNALVRTTTAVTIVKGGVQDNVLPKVAVATVNFRVAPGDTIESIRKHIVAVVDDPRVEVAQVEDGDSFGSEATAVSDTDSAAFEAIGEAIWASFGNEAIVAPGLTIGGTDVRHYQEVSQNQYRFLPIVLNPGDPSRIHGTDERIAVSDWQTAIRFYAALLKRL